MLDRNVKAKMDKLAKLTKSENPEELLNRYVKTLDMAVKTIVELKTELEKNRDAWKKGVV